MTRFGLRYVRLVAAAVAMLAVAAVALVVGPFGDGNFYAYAGVLAAQLTGRTQTDALRVGDATRHYRVYRPAVVTGRLGLVVILDGASGSGLHAEVATGFDSEANRLGWLAAYPDPEGSGPHAGWSPYPDAPGYHSDVAFISGLIDRMEASQNVDPRRVFVAGLSRGGMMAYRLACDLSSKVAAIASVAGNMATESGSARGVSCDLNQPVSVLAIHGRNDQEVPVDGGPSRVAKETVSYAPLADVIDRWRSLDGCTGSTQATNERPASTTTWSCRSATTVSVTLLSGVGHAWPGSPLYAVGRPDSAYDASRAIAEFFALHGRLSACRDVGLRCLRPTVSG